MAPDVVRVPLVLIQPTASSISGHETPRMPIFRITSNAREGCFAFIVLIHSSRTRSRETFAKTSRLGAIGALGLGVELELERRGEARGAQHAQAVLAEALERRAHGAQHAALEVLLPVVRIDDAAVVRVERDRVHREVAAREIVR